MPRLRLWLITQDTNNGYDTYDSAIVVAASEKEARSIHPNGGGRSFHDTWADAQHVTAKCVGIAANSPKAGEVVCASFNAG